MTATTAPAALVSRSCVVEAADRLRHEFAGLPAGTVLRAVARCHRGLVAARSGDLGTEALVAAARDSLGSLSQSRPSGRPRAGR